MKTIIMNNGYSQIKGTMGKSFKSAYRETNSSEYCNASDVLEFEGKYYVIGEGRTSKSKDKTSNIATKLFVLNMICQQMDTPSDHFNVVLTAPPLTYPLQKDSLPKYLIGTYKVVHRGIPREIFIDNVTVYPETIMAYIANNPARFKRPVIVIDVGGVTTNIAYIDNGKYNSESIQSYTDGVYHIEDEIYNFLNGKYLDVDLDASVTPLYESVSRGCWVENGTKNIFEVEKKSIENIYNRYISKMEDKIANKKWNIANCDLLVTGGGGKLLFDSIKTQYPNAILSNDPVFDNLNGMIRFYNMQEQSKRQEIATTGVR